MVIRQWLDGPFTLREASIAQKEHEVGDAF